MKVFISFYILAVLFIFVFTHPFPASATSQGPEGPKEAPYLKPLVPGVSIRTLLTVPSERPQTRNPHKNFRLIGIPDGMGLRSEKGEVFLLVNHELAKKDKSEPFVQGPPLFGAFVSEWKLDPKTGEILSGDLAYDSVQNGTDPAPRSGAFGRLCSSFLAGPAQGFDRWIYLTGEEAEGAETFDGKGGQAVAIADRKIYLLDDLGRFRKENIVPLPMKKGLTLMFALEDGPDGLESQLYLYVGRKKLSASHVLERNGLVGGTLYVWRSMDPKKGDEASFHKGEGPLLGRWMPLPQAKHLNDQELNRLSKKLGSFNFARIEDGTYDRNEPGVFYFATTGADPANKKGRLYRIVFSAKDPVANPSFLEVLLEGDRGDPIENPDNVELDEEGRMLILEDFTDKLVKQLSGGRDNSVWLYRLLTGELTRIAEINREGAPFFERGYAGFWEASGVIDASSIFGKGVWLLNVQAHSIGTTKIFPFFNLFGPPNYVEGGQLLLLQTAL